MVIDQVTDTHLGTYACYVYSSAGTIRRLAVIQKHSEHDFKVVEQTKKNLKKQIRLSIENQDHGFIEHVPRLNNRYYFECITGMAIYIYLI